MNDAPEKPKRNNPYLPALPEGWEYEVSIRGPHGAHVEIEQSGRGMTVATTTSDGMHRQTNAPDLATALRTAATGIKALHVVEQQEAEAKAARDAALATLGDESSFTKTEYAQPDLPPVE